MQRTVRQKCAARRNFRNLEVIRFNLWLNFRSDRMIHDGLSIIGTARTTHLAKGRVQQCIESSSFTPDAWVMQLYFEQAQLF